MRKYCNVCNEPLLMSQPRCTGCGAENPLYRPEFSILQNNEAKYQQEAEALRKELQDLQQKTQEQEAYWAQKLAQVEVQSANANQQLQQEIGRLQEQIQLLALQNEQLRQDSERQLLNLPENTTRRKRHSFVWFLLLPLLTIPLLAWVYIKTPWKNTAKGPEPVPQVEQTIQPEQTAPLQIETTDTATVEVVPVEEEKAMEESPTPRAWQLTERALVKDVVGKRISGCDVQVLAASDINNVEGLVLVEKINSSLYKYKCRLHITRNGTRYVATPYLYYRPGGDLVKIDGTNCEQQ